ncbi:hypothetical protein [Geomicrobium sp. JCM 19055]|uniref:hypothetical protein n=1 Tax=Geomicrobium sp. JCM 19055 TaxID=1460649 RepID=UPI0005A6E04C|nr:hypothetical protein [Geomicrobium sp. JCM 19055]
MENFHSQARRHSEGIIEVNNNLINGPGVIRGGPLPTIPTVPTVPPEDINFGRFPTAVTTVDSGGNLPLETNESLVGTAIRHITGDSGILLNEPGIYSLTYSANASAVEGNTVSLQSLQFATPIDESFRSDTSPSQLAATNTITVTNTTVLLSLNTIDATTFSDVIVTILKTS